MGIRRICGVAVLVSLIVAFALMAQQQKRPPAAQQAMTPEQVATIKKEVTDALHTYYRLYSEKNRKSLGTDVYLDPSIALLANGPEYHPTDKRQKEMDERVAQAGDRWGRYEYPNPVVCVLNPSAAIASGEFISYRRDGSSSPSGGTYIFGLTPAGWRIATYIPHATGKVVRCD
jgi:hypothetical protein